MYSTSNDAIFSKEFSSSDFSILTNLGAVMLFSISKQVSGKQLPIIQMSNQANFISISTTI